MLITFEGIDGSGKTTAAHALATFLKSKGVPIELMNKRDVSFDSAYLRKHMSKLKEVLWDYESDDPLHELGDRHWMHLQASWFSALDHAFVRPALAAGRIIVADNWTYKIMARFFLKNDISREDVAAAFGGLTRPSLVFFLDLPVSVALRRKATLSLSESGGMDGFGGAGAQSFLRYQEAVKRELAALGTTQRWRVLDAESEPSAIVDRCAAEVLRSLSGEVRSAFEAEPQDVP